MPDNRTPKHKYPPAFSHTESKHQQPKCQKKQHQIQKLGIKRAPQNETQNQSLCHSDTGTKQANQGSNMPNPERYGAQHSAKRNKNIQVLRLSHI